MSELKEYIVTAASYEILDELCQDIESPGGALYIPNRAVEIANLRPLSRNTHYYLTDDEADLLRKDPRVLSVEQLPEALGLTPRPFYVQSETTWNKSSTINATYRNWGLLRSYEGVTRSNWGSNGTTSQSGTIEIGAEAEGVDVVIVDGFINPQHPEYAVNSDGTGGSRVVQYNWYQHNPEVTGGAASTYSYGPYTGANNNHGAHVAGTVAGNTQGWARKSQIYNIYPYSTNPTPTLIFDYIRAFHRSKPIDPKTGLRRPTIVNNSWGYSAYFSYTLVESVTYRGTTYAGPFTINQLQNYGIVTDGSNNVTLSARRTDIQADIVDAINDGIIIVGSAGNAYQKNDILGGQDYNNCVLYNFGAYYYNRGSTPGADSKVICVGSVSSLVNESKSTFSNCGPRIDVYAPGDNITSSLNTGGDPYAAASDPRTVNGTFFLTKLSGTSMASPQVTGLLACALEVYPNMTQEQAIAYITGYAKTGQMTATTGGVTDYTDLQGSANRFLTYIKERPINGEVYPKKNYKARPSSGAVYPRTRIVRFGS